MFNLKTLVATLAVITTTTLGAPSSQTVPKKHNYEMAEAYGFLHLLPPRPSPSAVGKLLDVSSSDPLATNHTSLDYYSNRDHFTSEVGIPFHQTCASDSRIATAKWRVGCKLHPWSALMYQKRCWRNAPGEKQCCNGQSSDMCMKYWPQERPDGTSERAWCQKERYNEPHTLFEDEVCKCYDDEHCHNW